MPEESLYFEVFGLRAYWYGVCAALGALLALIVLCFTGKKRGIKADSVLLFGVIALPPGLICSRLLFCLLDANFRVLFSWKAAVTVWGGGLSMMGALLGAGLAGVIAAKLTKTASLSFMDALAPALLVFVMCARIGEGFTDFLGRSRNLNVDWFNDTFLATSDGYGSYNLNTYLLEAACALILAVAAYIGLCREKRAGDAFLTALLLCGCTQTLWESLRFDSHMRLSFVSLQQIMAACMFAVPLLIFAFRRGKNAVIAAAVVIVLLVGSVVGIELMIDRTDVSNVLLYIIYAAILTIPAVLGLIWKKKAKA
ncbi:MAG: prolipoprotein diacylglyceryl transferase [Clostridia bacterium]|nr:prolipoprotein diacylglyceryl transferase [Clostridia bacterium]